MTVQVRWLRWVRLASCAALLQSASACDLSRPAGAYDYDAAADDPSQYLGTDDPDAGSVDIPKPGSDKPPPDDPSDSSMPETDAAVPNSRLSGLVGHRYLMRLDIYSRGVTKDKTSGTTLEIHNRLSNLMLLDLSLKDGVLQGSETVCHQTLLTACTSGCSKWTTTPDTALAKRLQMPAPRTVREYAIDANGRLTVGQAYIALGFDEPSPSAATVLPTDASDPRVWSLAADSVRVGVHDFLEATLVSAPPLTLTQNLACNVSTAQLVSTAFTGRLDMTLDNPLSGDPLRVATGAPIKVDTNGSNAVTIAASGKPEMYCNKDTLVQTGAEQSDPDALSIVTFLSYDNYNGCPTRAEDYESAFPGKADKPVTFR